MTVAQLQALLDEQKRLVIQQLGSNTHIYNAETTDGSYKSFNIDKAKFTEQGIAARYPEHFEVLKRYIE